jgi:D-3-phosphoglycerate dehydrogenase
VLSKYGIGVDKVDLQAATALRMPVTFCPGVNHVTVAEHTFGLLLALTRQIPQHDAIVKRGAWHRGVGRERANKTLGLLGLSRIGRVVAQRAVACVMRVSAYDVTWDEACARQWGIMRHPTAEEVGRHADIVSLHMHLSAATCAYINPARLALMKPGAYLVNCARGGSSMRVTSQPRSSVVSSLATAPTWWNWSPWCRAIRCTRRQTWC